MTYQPIYKPIYKPIRKPIGSEVLGGGEYLLDTYSGAAAAYSLRRLNTAYTGPVVQVRRSGDSAEDTFSATEVGDGTLAAWVTAGGGTENGFVKTWYDQSGNGNDASQATAASQPQIVASGAVVAKGLSFNGTSYFLENTSVSISESYAFGVASFDVKNREDGIYQIGSVNEVSSILQENLNGGTIVFRRSSSADINSTSFSAGTEYLLTHAALNDSGQGFLNGNSQGSDSTLLSLISVSMLKIGWIGLAGRFYLDGTINELVIYNSDQSSNRTGIESNIASHYGITLS